MTIPRDPGSGQRRHFDGIANVKLLREIVRHLFNESTSIMLLFDRKGNVVEANRAACDGLNYPEETFSGMNFFSDLMAVPPAMKMEHLCTSLVHGESISLEGILRRNDGSAHAAQLSLSLLGEGAASLVLCSARTPEHEKAARENLRAGALRDPVTGLSTQAFFYEELKLMDTERNLPLSVIRADLNAMKLINSIFGHIAGDKLLKTAARVLRKHSRSSDFLIRWENDEFLLLLPRTREDDAASIVDRIEEAFRNSRLKELPVPPSISMGYAAKTHRWQDFGNVLGDAEEDMREKQLVESRKIRTKLLSSLQKSLNEHTSETEEHIDSMRRIAHDLGILLRLPDEEMGRLDMAVRLHDIGKAALSRHLLNKTAPITAEERETLRRHAEIGSRIVESATPEMAEIAPVILSHHERWDGAGYPSGLAGEAIPLLSRIVAVADAYDVMTRGTPYKSSISGEAALSELERLSGRQFDPKLVALFAEHAKIFQTNETPDALPERRK